MTAPSPEAPEQGEQAAVVGGWTKGERWKSRRKDKKFVSCKSWTVENDDASRTTWAAVQDQDGEVVALVVTADWDSDKVGRRADLIAAAPQMAEALRFALPMLAEAQEALIGRDDICVFEDEDGMRIALDMARAALLAAGAEVRS